MKQEKYFLELFMFNSRWLLAAWDRIGGKMPH